MDAITRIAITPGEPAGIGPDLVLAMAQRDFAAELVAVADPDLLAQRAQVLGLNTRLEPFDVNQPPQVSSAGRLKIKPVTLAASATPGRLNAANGPYVLATLKAALQGCLDGDFAALVTGPIQKSIINEAGIPFTGHTEFLAGHCGGTPVMLLMAANLRVALATTHLALKEVARAVTQQRLQTVIRVLARDLHSRFGIDQPRIRVCGLNPHAGESGHLGREEIEIIAPALDSLRQENLWLEGPVPADTAFTPDSLSETDAVLAMYHDQGLPVIKHAGFGHAVNCTLGLPIIRTSVDHGTALPLAGTGRADPGSLAAATRLAIELSR